MRLVSAHTPRFDVLMASVNIPDPTYLAMEWLLSVSGSKPIVYVVGTEALSVFCWRRRPVSTANVPHKFELVFNMACGPN